MGDVFPGEHALSRLSAAAVVAQHDRVAQTAQFVFWLAAAKLRRELAVVIIKALIDQPVARGLGTSCWQACGEPEAP